MQPAHFLMNNRCAEQFAHTFRRRLARRNTTLGKSARFRSPIGKGFFPNLGLVSIFSLCSGSCTHLSLHAHAHVMLTDTWWHNLIFEHYLSRRARQCHGTTPVSLKNPIFIKKRRRHRPKNFKYEGAIASVGENPDLILMSRVLKNQIFIKKKTGQQIRSKNF